MACCPAHDDSSPSLSVAEASDGRVLVKCFGGCSALDVITAVGLEWDDLFPESDKHHRSLARSLGIRPAGAIDNRIVELAQQTAMTSSQREEAKRAAIRGGKPDGFTSAVANNLPENKEWSEQLLACERELHKADMALKDEMRVLLEQYPMAETEEHRQAIAAWEDLGK
jgi:hypothetical protein